MTTITTSPVRTPEQVSALPYGGRTKSAHYVQGTVRAALTRMGAWD